MNGRLNGRLNKGPAVVVLAAVLLLAAGCEKTPDAGPTQQPTRATSAAATSRTLDVPAMLDDCAALAGMVPKEVSSGMGVDGSFGTPYPSTEKAYSAYCSLLGQDASQSRLRVGMQLLLIRPRVEPYESKPLAEWFRGKPREFTSVSDCGTPAPWSSVPNGYRCFKDNPAGATRLQIVAGADKGTVVQVQVTMLQSDKQNLVPLDMVRAESDKAAELTIKALFNGI